MRALYHITKDFEKLDHLLDTKNDQGDEYSLATDGEIDDQLVKIMESLEAEAGAKLDNYLDYIAHLEMMSTAAGKQAAYWQLKYGEICDKIDTLKDRIKTHFQARGIKKLVSATGRTVTLVANGGKQKVIYDRDTQEKIETLPLQFVKTVTHKIPNGDAVRKALEEGRELSFARLEERGFHIRIG
jgi:uncharacterized protein Veg